ncbi:MAG TPA: hypothetical protein VJN18_16975 [Polyangiaceae bacterium]|nr:hypothetical protein [Polyangiaceae bacterium]
MTRVRALRRLGLVLAGLCLAGCLSPTLPLPPPAKPDVSAPNEDGFARIQGVAAPQAEVIAWNRSSDLLAGQVTGDDSRYDFLIRAEAGDRIDVWYTQGTDESTSTSVIVPAAR